MREMTVEIGGEDCTLRATFAAAKELADKVGDPMRIAREAAIERVMLAQGLPYEPKWRFGVENVPLIIHIGLKAGGSDMRLSDVQDWVFDIGFNAAVGHAAQYLALINGPRPEKDLGDDEAEDTSPGE